MVIKSKGWTAIPAVKVVSFVLVILLAFAFCGIALLMDLQNSGNRTSLELALGNISGNNMFYVSYMDRTLNDLQSLLFFENEENIRAGNCLRWVERDGGVWLEASDGSRTWSYLDATEYRVLEDPGPRISGEDGSVPGASSDENSSTRIIIDWDEDLRGQEGQLSNEQIRLKMESLEKTAINNQLQEFRWLQSRIESYSGLVYYVAKEGFEYSNAGHSDMDFYAQQPVYLIVRDGLNVLESHRVTIPVSGDGDIYIGYTAEAIGAQTTHWQSMQRTVIAQIAAIIAIVVAAGLLFIALLCGAGRKRGSDAVYFNVLDKPYLDVGFGMLLVYEVIIYEIFRNAFAAGYYGYYGNGTYGLPEQPPRTAFTLSAVLIALILPPALYYTMSFAKRFKAGYWWRHTLTWRMWDEVRSTCVNFAKSLWAGVPLTLRVGGICVCLWGVMLSIGYAGGIGGKSMAIALVSSMSLCSVVLIAVLLLRYARKLNKLATGAKAVSEGRYGNIDLQGGLGSGTLDSIAESINNISAGIESAVDERLKSERLKTELITNVSHDIRTPLTSLITYTDLLKSEGLASERAPEYLDILIQKSQRLKTLTDELFEAAKASSGNIETHIEHLDFAALMRQVLGELDERVQASSLDFRTTLPEHMWVAADGKLLWRAVENLLSNVFKYSLPQSRVYIDLASKNGYARLDIKNISAEPLNMEPSELTERFKRGDDSRSSEGSGLGLSIVQSFVEVQNGRFKIAIDGDLFKASLLMPETNRSE